MKALVPTPPSRTSQGPKTGSCSTLFYTRSSSWQTPSAAPCDVREGTSAFFYRSPRPWGIGRWCPCWHRGRFQQQFVRRKGQNLVGQIAGRHSLLAGRDSLVGMLTSLSCKLQGTSRSCYGQARLQCLGMTGLVDGAQPCSLAQMETILTLVP